MIVSLLIILRDRGLPLPAGAILISPWVDLTHSFPSLAGDGSSDYIPAHGFLQRPSAAWPPPNSNDMEKIAMHAVEQVAGEALPRKSSQAQRREAREEAIQGFSVDHTPKNLHPKENADNPYGTEGAGERPGNTIPGPGHELSIMLDGKLIEIKDQIHMYTTNQLISHPLVSPVLQPSLGGLPPLLIMTGGAEILRDEQIYLGHKAANPAKYPPGEAYLDEYPEARDVIAKYGPTDVQLQVWEDLCHVAPTLSFTKPAKYMFRSIAQFGAWALARAQKTEIDIMDDEELSVISSGSITDSDKDMKKPKQTKSTMKNGVAQGGTARHDQIGRAGDPLPSFKDHMIRQRVDRHGGIFPLDPPASLPSLQISSNEVGVIKPGPVMKWMEAKKKWDTKYAREKRNVQKQRVREMAKGYQGFGDDEVPPPSALAGRIGLSMPKEEKKSRSWGMSLWSLWGSSHDEDAITREEKADKEIGSSTAVKTEGVNGRTTRANKDQGVPRSRSRRRTVTDAGQTNSPVTEQKNQGTVNGGSDKSDSLTNLASVDRNHPIAPTINSDQPNPPDNATSTQDPIPNATSSNRPTADGVAFPFKPSSHLVGNGRNASTVTLQSQVGIVSLRGDEKGRQLGESMANSTGQGEEHVEELKHQQLDESSKTQNEEVLKAVSNGTNEHANQSIVQSDNQGWRQGPQGEKIRRIGNECIEDICVGRSATLEDSKGVLYHGPVSTGNAEKSGSTNAESERPVVGKSDSASLD